MLSSGMYVRCPADKENMAEPRVFVCGQITKVDEFKKTVSVRINDPFGYLLFFEDLPNGVIELPETIIDRCNFFIDSVVVYNRENCKVLSLQKSKDGFYYYYLQNLKNKQTKRVCEKDIVASFNNGHIDPCSQIVRYEFQNPCWYLGRAVVSKSMNILENSIYGFKELAGSKIYLMPHQVNSIMRCLQESPCRYMLADEVGMGKTVEAISVYKIYSLNQSNSNALIVVPAALKAQWQSELLLKFNIPEGKDVNGNSLTVKSIYEISNYDLQKAWDFIIIDEVHKFLFVKDEYLTLYTLSKSARNLLLLSATPIQQKKEEYLDLLRLLLPQKYDKYSVEEFGELISKQSKIIQKTALVLDDLSDLEETISEAEKSDEDPHESEECIELLEEIQEDLESICDALDDDKLHGLLAVVDKNEVDLGVYAIKVVISYICGNYQIESNIIRNRRKILESRDSEEKIMASRDLIELTYEPDAERNVYEHLAYEDLTKWIMKGLEVENIDVEKDIKPLLSTFFSSPWAFDEVVNHNKIDVLKSNVENWIESEQFNIDHIDEILDDPDSFSDCYASRLVVVLDALYDEYYDKKVVLFTNYKETFEAYKKTLLKAFPEEEISFFGANMPVDEIELNAYRFQSQEKCRILLCDYTGGEGRNFQCADYIFHIDMPWDASAVEQRIGRLDRLERDMSRPIVYSVVIHTINTFEDALFNFFKDGLHIFNQSLSGMEIIMRDINDEIISAISTDFKYGLFEKIPAIVDLANKMREDIRKEQNFDAAGFIYKPMYSELRRLIDYYAENENALFATTMSKWASLAGFHGHTSKSGEITYSAISFSPKSAINSQLIPPKWNEYLSTSQNKFILQVQAAFDKKMERKSLDRSIKGTFSRKLAIENDYLHFFAPGDEIFDCIVDNAINSCKGCSSAFAVKCNINWTGLVFIWSIEPNNVYLMDNGISVHSMSLYRNYLLSEQVVCPVSLNNEDSLDDEEIVREYREIISAGFIKSKTIHLGKRSRDAGFFKDKFDGRNIDWFISTYCGEKWSDFVINARKESYDKAIDIFKKKSNIRGAREEMERNLSARVANSDYYGIDDNEIEKLKETQIILLEAMRKPIIRLESVAFIIMVGENDE